MFSQSVYGQSFAYGQPIPALAYHCNVSAAQIIFFIPPPPVCCKVCLSEISALFFFFFISHIDFSVLLSAPSATKIHSWRFIFVSPIAIVLHLPLLKNTNTECGIDNAPLSSHLLGSVAVYDPFCMNGAHCSNK